MFLDENTFFCKKKEDHFELQALKSRALMFKSYTKVWQRSAMAITAWQRYRRIVFRLTAEVVKEMRRRALTTL